MKAFLRALTFRQVFTVGFLQLVLNKIIRKIRLYLDFKRFYYRYFTLRLKMIYLHGNKRNAGRKNITEPVSPEVISLGVKLSQEAILHCHDMYSDKPYRFLFQMPPNGVGVLYFNDLIQALEYSGIPCATVEWHDPDFRKKWEAFKPNIFISIDIAEVLESLDLKFISQYKKANGCARLFNPVPTQKFPQKGLSSKDEWRLSLARSRSSLDGYFYVHVEDYFDCFFEDWVKSGLKYLSIPFACNPVIHYPRSGNKQFDYFIATTYDPIRVMMTWDYMRPVFRRYYGQWAGPGWGFGLGFLSSAEVPDIYAKTKIVTNPLSGWLKKYPGEVTERAFSATACGAFQLTDWSPITDRFFANDEIVTVKSNTEFLDAFGYYINKPDERNAIVMKAMKRVFTEHTYFQRVTKLISFLDNNKDLF